MDRNKFMTLAMRHALGEDVRVKYQGIEYYPISYTIGCRPNATYSHTALLKDVTAADSYMHAPMDEVEGEQP